MKTRWRNGDLVRAIPIPRADLHQAISRDGFRPEHTPDPGKDRWYSWRDVVAVAVAQDLRRIGFGPSIAFGLVARHLSEFLRTRTLLPGDCDRVLWLIQSSETSQKNERRRAFVRYAKLEDLSISPRDGAMIVVNVGLVANRILDALQADREKLTPAERSVTPHTGSNL